MKFLSTALLTLLIFGGASAQIQLDNRFNDWTNQPLVTNTEEGPFIKASVTSNVDWLYLYVEMLNEVALDEDVLPNDLRILLDLDDDLETGCELCQSRARCGSTH